MADPLIMDPNYVMTAMSMAALQRLIDNPYTEPDTTPPVQMTVEEKARRNILATAQRSMLAPHQQSPGDAPPRQLPPPVKIAELSDEDKQALDVLKRDDIVEQVDEHSWRFKR